jgi:aspartate aminotransferase
MPALSERAQALPASAIRLLDAYVRKRPDVRFWRINIGQPDVPTPPAMQRALNDFQPDVHAYGPASGIPAARQAAARYHSRWSPGLEEAHVAVTTGGSEALLYAFATICDPGDELLAPEPFYANYRGFANTVGASLKPLPTTLETGFRPPPDHVLDAAVGPRTKGIVFSNPGNPTGAVWPASELERVLRWAERHDLFVISDEVYRRLWYGDAPPSVLEFPEYAQRTLCVDSLSKTFSACGLRVGFLISRNTDFMVRIERFGMTRLGPQPLAQYAAIAALELPESYYEELRLRFKSRCNAMHQALSSLPGVVVHKPEGAFYMMATLPVEDAADFALFMARDFEHKGESVIVAPGSGFYETPGAGVNQIRVAAVLEPHGLLRATELLGRGLQAYSGS